MPRRPRSLPVNFKPCNIFCACVAPIDPPHPPTLASVNFMSAEPSSSERSLLEKCELQCPETTEFLTRYCLPGGPDCAHCCCALFIYLLFHFITSCERNFDAGLIGRVRFAHEDAAHWAALCVTLTSTDKLIKSF